MKRVLEAYNDSKVAHGLVFRKGLNHCVELVDKSWIFICVGSETEYLRMRIKTSLERFKK
jgi:hypothetical protein